MEELSKRIEELERQKAELIEALKKVIELWEDPKNPSGTWDHQIHAIAKQAIKNAE